ncbi:hypothetical protein DRW03_27380 [Corallococcus sp. H22C18031201]|nr:hypothetical protein DRW03_27380 [Corallococcus sp. H22C18031201]
MLGSREVATREDSCASLDSRLALVIAVMIDPEPARAPEPSVPPEPPPAPTPSTREPPVAEALEDSVAPWPGRSTVSLSAAVATGLGVPIAPGASVDWRGAERVSWLARLSVFPAATSGSGPSEVQRMAVAPEVGVCPWGLGRADWALAGCVTTGLSFVIADSHRDAATQSQLLVRGDLGARFQWVHAVARTTGLQAGAGVSMGWSRPEVTHVGPDGGTVTEPLGSPVQVHFDVGLAFRGP